MVTPTQTTEQQKMKTTTQIDLGNNESISRGISTETDGTFTAMTFTQSKNFKTLKGAQKWLAARV
jgi:hypothetical protein